MTKTTVSSRGQIAIPKAVRERLNLKAGTELAIDILGQSLILKKVVSDLPDWRTMEGMARGGESLTKALMEERAADKAHDEARVKGPSLPIRVDVPDADEIMAAARIKASHAVAYGDSFDIALARAHGASVITGDLEIQQSGLVSVDWVV